MSRERACIQMILDSQGILEFASDVYDQIQSNKLSTTNLESYSKKYLSKKEQILLSTFLSI